MLIAFFVEVSLMLVGYCRISVADDRQTTDLQRDALLTGQGQPQLRQSGRVGTSLIA